MPADAISDECIIFYPSKTLRLYIILAAIMVIAAMVVGWNYYDVMWWIQWYKIVEEKGPTSLLEIYRLCSPSECKAPYPPLAIVIFVAAYAPLQPLPPIMRMILLKVLLVLIPGLVVYRILKRSRGPDVALVWVISIPFLQILLALQFDVLIALLILLSINMVLHNKIVKSAILLALATLIKHVVVIALPIYVMFLWARKSVNTVAKYVAVYLSTVGGIVLPFFIAAPNEFLGHILFFHSSRAPQDLSLWALPTLIHRENVALVQTVVSNIWGIFFAVCYTAVTYLLYRLLKTSRTTDINKVLPLSISTILLMYIALNKIGNLNYVVWTIPPSFIVLKRKHIKTVFKLTTLLGLAGALVYIFMLYIPPASANAPVFIVEDLTYWNARALIAQSLNYYLFYILSLSYAPFIHLVDSSKLFSTPTDFVSRITFFRFLHAYSLPIMISTLVISQTILTVFLVLKIQWLKQYWY